MIKSITYFEENCIKKFEKLENDFLKNPLNMAEYVYGITEELHKLGREMITEVLEMMDQMLAESSVGKKNWVVEAHKHKTIGGCDIPKNIVPEQGNKRICLPVRPYSWTRT